MTFEHVLLVVCALPIGLPVVVAIFARRSPLGVRIALLMAGLASGCYVAARFSEVERSSGGFKDLALVGVPLVATAAAFYVAIFGVALSALIGSWMAGTPFTLRSVLSLLLCLLCIGVAVIYGNAVLSWPRL